MGEVKQWPAGKPVPTRQRPARGRAAKNPPSVASAIAAEAADDALPRYMQVARRLTAVIADDPYPIGSQLPTGLEICQELNLSRFTASLYCPYKYSDTRMRTTHTTREAPVNQTNDTVNKADLGTAASRVSSRIAAFATDLSFDAIPPAVTDRAGT